MAAPQSLPGAGKASTLVGRAAAWELLFAAWEQTHIWTHHKTRPTELKYWVSWKQFEPPQMLRLLGRSGEAAFTPGHAARSLHVLNTLNTGPLESR